MIFSRNMIILLSAWQATFQLIRLRLSLHSDSCRITPVNRARNMVYLSQNLVLHIVAIRTILLFFMLHDMSCIALYNNDSIIIMIITRVL